MTFRFLLIAVSSIFCHYVSFAQDKLIGELPISWPAHAISEIQKNAESDNNSDLVILNEQTDIFFYAANNEKIIKTILIKINSDEGLQKIQNYKLPESFDESNDANLFKQGRQSKIKTPFITEYTVTRFGGRKLQNHVWQDLSFKQSFEKLRWIRSNGEFMDDEMTKFALQGLKTGDVIELFYEAKFNSNYGSNLFYLQSSVPKINCDYTFIYKVEKQYADYGFILPLHIIDSAITTTIEDYRDYYIFKKNIKLKNLSGINFLANSFISKNAPHVFADFRFFRMLVGSYPAETRRLFDYMYFRPKNFEWVLFKDTNNYFTKVYDKQFASIRKFAGTLPQATNDSTKVIFFKALCDTFNSFRFISANQLFYNESNLYNVSSGDHLLKRRLSEQSLGKLYRDILNESKTFYYVANIQDKRFGEHNLSYRAHYAYEGTLFAMPNKNSFVYFMPRYSGMKYHLNELPFYYESSLAVLAARNFQDETENKDSKSFKFIKTHKGTYNENTRTENATVKISLDSSKANFSIKESLSGQYSTLLRHLYLNEYIDSTVSKFYFKKCVEKPFASDIKTKLTSNITNFPFRYTFACSEKVEIKSTTDLDLKDWFSFSFSPQLLKESPNQDYYFDFEFTDSYNFLLDFGLPVELTNANDFAKKINNSYFDLESEIIKNSAETHLLKVKVQVKQLKIPLKEITLLNELLIALNDVNNFTLTTKRL
jgi:hypothetical protein